MPSIPNRTIHIPPARAYPQLTHYLRQQYRPVKRSFRRFHRISRTRITEVGTTEVGTIGVGTIGHDRFGPYPNSGNRHGQPMGRARSEPAKQVFPFQCCCKRYHNLPLDRLALYPMYRPILRGAVAMSACRSSRGIGLTKVRVGIGEPLLR